MPKGESPPSSVESVEARAIRLKEEIKQKLEGWWASSDGEDYCPDCWPEYLKQFDEKVSKLILGESKPTAELVKYRKASDGYWVDCAGCRKVVQGDR